jgi:hypothetical protein
MLAFDALEMSGLKHANGSGFVVIAALHTDGLAVAVLCSPPR